MPGPQTQSYACLFIWHWQKNISHLRVLSLPYHINVPSYVSKLKSRVEQIVHRKSFRHHYGSDFPFCKSATENTCRYRPSRIRLVAEFQRYLKCSAWVTFRLHRLKYLFRSTARQMACSIIRPATISFLLERSR